MTAILFFFIRKATPFESCCATFLDRSTILAASNFRLSALNPNSPKLCIRCQISEERSSAFVGMQRQLRQMPPSRSRSTIAVFKPSCAARMAQTYPPGPLPTTMTSKDSAKRASEETERENSGHCRQQEEQRVDTGNEEKLEQRRRPALLVETFHREKNIDGDYSKQQPSDRLAGRDLSECGRANQDDERECVDAQGEHQMIDEVEVLASPQVKKCQEQRIQRQQQEQRPRQPVCQRPIEGGRIGSKAIDAAEQLQSPPTLRAVLP